MTFVGYLMAWQFDKGAQYNRTLILTLLGFFTFIINLVFLVIACGRQSKNASAKNNPVHHICSTNMIYGTYLVYLNHADRTPFVALLGGDVLGEVTDSFLLALVLDKAYVLLCMTSRHSTNDVSSWLTLYSPIRIVAFLWICPVLLTAFYSIFTSLTTGPDHVLSRGRRYVDNTPVNSAKISIGQSSWNNWDNVEIITRWVIFAILIIVVSSGLIYLIFTTLRQRSSAENSLLSMIGASVASFVFIGCWLPWCGTLLAVMLYPIVVTSLLPHWVYGGLVLVPYLSALWDPIFCIACIKPEPETNVTAPKQSLSPEETHHRIAKNIITV